MIELQASVRDFGRFPGEQFGHEPPLPPVIDDRSAFLTKGCLGGADATKELDHIVGVMSIHGTECTRSLPALSNTLSAARATLWSMLKTTLPQRLQTIMDAMGWSQADLARAAKSTRQSVTNWMTEVSGSRNIEPKFAFNLSDVTRFNARWIIYGDGPARMELSTPDDEKLLSLIRKLPEERKRVLIVALGL